MVSMPCRACAPFGELNRRLKEFGCLWQSQCPVGPALRSEAKQALPDVVAFGVLSQCPVGPALRSEFKTAKLRLKVDDLLSQCPVGPALRSEPGHRNSAEINAL